MQTETLDSTISRTWIKSNSSKTSLHATQPLNVYNLLFGKIFHLLHSRAEFSHRVEVCGKLEGIFLWLAKCSFKDEELPSLASFPTCWDLWRPGAGVTQSFLFIIGTGVCILPWSVTTWLGAILLQASRKLLQMIHLWWFYCSLVVEVVTWDRKYSLEHNFPNLKHYISG